MLNCAEEKSRLRVEYARRRQQVALREQELAAAKVAERLSNFPPLAAMDQIGMYWAVRGELATGESFFLLRSRGCKLYFPRVRDSEPAGLEFAEVDDPKKMVPGPYGILEPPSSDSAVHLERIPALLIPGIAFDEQGHRIGWGKGYYDKLLQGFPGTKVGLAYDFQVLNSIPCSETDQSMDFIVTERRMIECRSQQA
jgi:5,10-methenyltetrahydrofolate synthetase